MRKKTKLNKNVLKANVNNKDYSWRSFFRALLTVALVKIVRPRYKGFFLQKRERSIHNEG